MRSCNETKEIMAKYHSLYNNSINNNYNIINNNGLHRHLGDSYLGRTFMMNSFVLWRNLKLSNH
jgi:hypothetical protein